MQPPFSPDYYNVSYVCQTLMCTAVGFVIVTTTSHIFFNSSLAPGSSCTISVVAVYINAGMSNTVSSTVNTTAQGVFACRLIFSCMSLSHAAAPTSAPEGLTSTSVESRSLTVQWGTVPCPDQRGPITGYRIRYSNGTSIVNTTGEGSRQHVLTGLIPFTSYSVQVAAVNAGGTGPYSTALTVETLQDSE